MNEEKPPAQIREDGSLPDVFLPLRNFVEKNTQKSSRIHLAAIAGLGLLTVFLFLNLLDSDFSAMQKAIGAAILFILFGEIARAFGRWDGFWGLILFRDRSTLSWIDRQAKKYSAVWIALADLGLVLGYGLSSWVLIGAEQKKDKHRLAIMYIGGLLILIMFSALAAPMAMPVIVGMVSGTDITSASAQMRETVSGIDSFSLAPYGIDINVNWFSLALFVVLVLFGLAGSVLISLVMYSVMIIPAIVGSIGSFILSVFGMGTFNSDDVPAPGGAPILPGVNLPFFEGILALAALLVVHEMSHGLLARIAEIKLDSAGLVFFGILPFGAFVEPDEKHMHEIEKYKENRILVAGSASNIIFAIISFFALSALLYTTYDLRLEGYTVTGGNLPAGAIVQSIDGIEYSGQNLTIAPNKEIVIVTDEGTFTRTTNEDGKVGITMARIDKSGYGFRYKFVDDFEWLVFVLNTLGLLFATNMLVGVVNLLPIPLFDGNRIMVNGVSNDRIAFAITAVASIAFAVNLLPWIFR